MHDNCAAKNHQWIFAGHSNRERFILIIVASCRILSLQVINNLKRAYRIMAYDYVRIMILTNSNVTLLGLLTARVYSSVTVRLNTRDVATVGAVNVGVAAFAPVSDTGVPDV